MTIPEERKFAHWVTLPQTVKDHIDAGPTPQVLAKQFLDRPIAEIDMDQWMTECGTTACLAGWALHDAGGGVFTGLDDDELPEHWTVMGNSVDIFEAGAYALGLGRAEATAMFLETHDMVIKSVVAERFGLEA